MASIYEKIPGYLDAVARETVGRDAAYLRLPRLVVGVALRPLTLRDYLRLSAEGSPFVAGGRAGRDHVCFLLWHQQAQPDPAENEQGFAARFDRVDLNFLIASCRAYVAEALADASPGGSKRGGYWGLGASIISKLRREYKCGREEILDMPLDEIFQELRAIDQHHNPKAVFFNRSDSIKGQWQRQRSPGLVSLPEAKPSERKPKR